MAGSKLGGQKAAQTNKARHGDDFYRKIGVIGGRNGRTGGFAAGEEGRERARAAGRLGGLRSSQKRKEGDELQRG